MDFSVRSQHGSVYFTLTDVKFSHVTEHQAFPKGSKPDSFFQISTLKKANPLNSMLGLERTGSIWIHVHQFIGNPS